MWNTVANDTKAKKITIISLQMKCTTDFVNVTYNGEDEKKVKHKVTHKWQWHKSDTYLSDMS